MQVVNDMQELTRLCDGDTLCLWMAQNLESGSRAWRSDESDALAIAGPHRSGRDRFTVVASSVDSAQHVALAVVDEIGADYRLLARPTIVDAVVSVVPGLVPVEKPFGWMERRTAVEAPSASRALWLTESDERAITDVLDAGFPESYVRPGVDGEIRWAGVRHDCGRLGAVAALAWSTPQVGLLAGVATSPRCRRLGMGYEVCDFVIRRALTEYGAVALMVDRENRAARSLYEKLGLSYRPLRAASFDQE